MEASRCPSCGHEIERTDGNVLTITDLARIKFLDFKHRTGEVFTVIDGKGGKKLCRIKILELED